MSSVEFLLATPEVFGQSENLPRGKLVSFQFCVNDPFEVDQQVWESVCQTLC